MGNLVSMQVSSNSPQICISPGPTIDFYSELAISNRYTKKVNTKIKPRNPVHVSKF